MSLFFLGKHFSHGLYGRARTKNKTPATTTRAPAQPTHVTDHDISWCRGMDWSLAKYESTDWWKTMRQMKIKTPVERQEKRKSDVCKFMFLGFYQQSGIALLFLNHHAAYVLAYIVG